MMADSRGFWGVKELPQRRGEGKGAERNAKPTSNRFRLSVPQPLLPSVFSVSSLCLLCFSVCVIEISLLFALNSYVCSTIEATGQR